MRTRYTTRICFICTELGHLTKNYTTTGRIEDKKKAKVDNIKNKMRSKNESDYFSTIEGQNFDSFFDQTSTNVDQLIGWNFSGRNFNQPVGWSNFRPKKF